MGNRFARQCAPSESRSALSRTRAPGTLVTMSANPNPSRLGAFEIVGELETDPVWIDGDEVILGRDLESDIVFEDSRVSRRHAESGSTSTR
jgi:pSer/pThr/pTyr-binding forkhead associated (FHA) protein